MPPELSSLSMAATPPSNANAGPALRLVGVHKTFPGVRALRGVGLEVYPGEIHILLGENGAGKSTLLRIAGGAIPKDAGEIYVFGRRVELRGVWHARQLGIGMVHQELSLIPDLSVSENVVLGQWPRGHLHFVDWRAVRRAARAALESLGVQLDLDCPVRTLPLAEQQLVEIARVLSLNARILLLDEPTSALGEAERQRLFRVLRDLRNRGFAVLYTSHRLVEVSQIGDRVSVLRDGQGAGTFPVGQVDEDALVRRMVGRALADRFPKAQAALGQPRLEVQGLWAGCLADVSFTVHAGEVLGVFGLRGSGRTTLARVLFGLEPVLRGTVRVDGRPVVLRCPGDAVRAGLGYVTEDRRQSLVPVLPVAPNVTLPSLRRFTRLGLLDGKAERSCAERLVGELGIHPPDLLRPVSLFSGGNQQKVVLARWLASGVRVLVLDEPTRGIDVGAKREVFALIGDLVRQGVGVLLLSSEIPELLSVADRILVLRTGRVTAEFPRGRATQEDVLRAATELTEVGV